jgi:hypothetical protein
MSPAIDVTSEGGLHEAVGVSESASLDSHSYHQKGHGPQPR